MYMYVRVYIYTHTNTRKDKKWRKVFFFRQTINYIIQIQQLEKKKSLKLMRDVALAVPKIGW